LLALFLPPCSLGQGDLLTDRPELPLLVRLPDEVTPEQAPAYLASLGLEALRPIPQIHVWRARPLPSRPAALEALRESLADRVLWIEQDGLVQAQEVIPDDPYYATYQWNLPLVGLEQAWLWSQGGEVVIAIIDTGLDLAHPDLQARLWVNEHEIPGTGQDDDGNGYIDDVHGWDFLGTLYEKGDPFPQDENGHGTHVAGIAGAHTNNGIGVAGVGWGVRLMAVRVLDASGYGSWSNVAEAMIYAAANGARVLNLSLGGDTLPAGETVSDAVAYARGLGCLIVAAAGNAGGAIQYPARMEGVMAVAATTKFDGPVLGYSRGPQMDVAAPGSGVYSTRPVIQGSYGYMSGTSMATPHVSGLAALLWAYDPTLTAAQVTQIITSTAQDVHDPGWDERTGWGRIDAQAAITSLILPQLERRHLFPLIFRRMAP
jgi:subtilisin family serine protease